MKFTYSVYVKYTFHTVFFCKGITGDFSELHAKEQ